MEVINDMNAGTVAESIADAIRENRIDEAEALLPHLYELNPSAKDLLIFPALIAIQRGFVLDVLQHINGLEDDRCPEIKVLCLFIIGDPTWHGAACSLETSPDPAVRKAMQQLLNRPETGYIE